MKIDDELLPARAGMIPVWDDMERRAYGIEIELAKQYGYNDLVDRLEVNLREELNQRHGRT
ncbi:MAG: hypothetical protein IKE43_10580 [Coriobacteriales bacterium]|nr:hypothetical protein [Coriobacteriales bacterium]